MICEVVGKSKRPYELTDDRGKTRSGISCRLSVHVGAYEVDPTNNVLGEGEQFSEYRCPENVSDGVSVGDTVSVELDDKKTRIKSAMVQIDGGGFMPV